MDSNLTWKYHIDYVASKISKIVGITARLRHYVPLRSGCLGSSCSFSLNKILVLQKRALRLVYFSKSREHAVPLFISSNMISCH